MGELTQRRKGAKKKYKGVRGDRRGWGDESGPIGQFISLSPPVPVSPLLYRSFRFVSVIKGEVLSHVQASSRALPFHTERDRRGGSLQGRADRSLAPGRPNHRGGGGGAELLRQQLPPAPQPPPK